MHVGARAREKERCSFAFYVDYTNWLVVWVFLFGYTLLGVVGYLSVANVYYEFYTKLPVPYGGRKLYATTVTVPFGC